MKLIEHKSKFTHKSMSSWGVGVYLESDGDYISVEFENAGIKKFGKSVIGTTLIPVNGTTEDTMATDKQNIPKSTIVSADNQSTSYYIRVVFIDLSPEVCYTIRDAVDWFVTPTARRFKGGSNHSALSVC